MLDVRPLPHEAVPTRAHPLLELKQLDWDTDFFGDRMGTIALTPAAESVGGDSRRAVVEAELARRLHEAAAADFAHLIFRVPAEDVAATWAAEAAGLRLVDVGIDSTFSFERSRAPAVVFPAPSIRPARPDDLPRLQDLAATAFVFSRFGADPFFSTQQVEAFHRQWITNLCNGLAQAVLVAEVDGAPAGFISAALHEDEGRIPLIATEAATRRRGLGRALVDTALRWFMANGARLVHVKTQATNYPALALYHRAGFAVSKSELTFSIALRPHRASQSG